VVNKKPIDRKKPLKRSVKAARNPGIEATVAPTAPGKYQAYFRFFLVGFWRAALVFLQPFFLGILTPVILWRRF
jgi:hypothetical protein